jgi:hypothetical protein
VTNLLFCRLPEASGRRMMSSLAQAGNGLAFPPDAGSRYSHPVAISGRLGAFDRRQMRCNAAWIAV